VCGRRHQTPSRPRSPPVGAALGATPATLALRLGSRSLSGIPALAASLEDWADAGPAREPGLQACIRKTRQRGIAGLAQAWDAAAPLLGTPQAIPDALNILATALWLFLVGAYLAQGPRIVLADLRDPVLSPFVPVSALTAGHRFTRQ
jgi:hypothetical protein